ncbi:molecular chaperone IbpA [Nitrospirillum amazonense]|uniref:Molecular chaperone IbpA n=1 Tax=Nitrospirillum amazonense TaxID=28077 RepID=A0A560FHR2_9PROT|nr:Hsp20 family protein [Nitrospirillum amazonense]TWB21153.1 molecular chaperone IbpA [Nitrospirillum amazonense]
MRSYDLSPLFRSTVGFDRLTRLMESALKTEDQGNAYPPYNIEKRGDDDYRITMAVAGFSQEEIDIVTQENALTVIGKSRKDDQAAPQTQYLHRGIAGRAFERRFQLAEHIRVTGAALENGLLHIDLVREVPETAKPRHIPIANLGQSSTALPTGQAAN